MFWIPDRFWWVQRVWGVVLVLGAVASLLWLVVQILGLFNFAGLGTGWQIVIPLLIIAVIFLLALTLGVLHLAGPFLVGVGYLWGASPARGRFQQRLRAIQGDQDAMPRAKIQVDASRASRLSGSTLELIWRPTALLRLLVALMDLIFLPVFGFFAGVGMYVAYEIVGTNQNPGLFWLARIGLLLLDVSGVVCAPLIVMGIFFCTVPMLLGKPYGLIANDDGIVYRALVTRRRYVLRWEEIGLFEVEQATRRGKFSYRLYGRRVIARWFDYPPSKGGSLGVTKEEFEQRHQALLDLIVARTGLMPRTFDEKLAKASNA
jgi:hypothetical protein